MRCLFFFLGARMGSVEHLAYLQEVSVMLWTQDRVALQKNRVGLMGRVPFIRPGP